MKRFTGTASIAIAIGILFSANVKAITPTQFSSEKMIVKTDVSVEDKIELEDWMLSFEMVPKVSVNAVEQEIRLETWMIGETWSYNENQVVCESELELEDWMTKKFRQENRIMALGL